LTFKDIAKLVQSQTRQISNTANLLAKLHGKDFWVFNQLKHEAKGRSINDKCCFNHSIGLPEESNTKTAIGINYFNCCNLASAQVTPKNFFVPDFSAICSALN
jgi:hypothetical protein